MPSNTAKYFDRKARPSIAPASANQRVATLPCDRTANQNANPDRKDQKTSGVSVVMKMFQT